MYAKNVEELVIYQIALELAEEIDKLIKQMPNYWGITACKQILRSSDSVSSNITEGFSHRFYVKQFLRYLYIAMGSSDESQNHIEKLRNSNHLKPEIADDYYKRYKSLSVKILNFINYLKKKHNIRI